MTSIDLQLPDEQAARLDRVANSMRLSRSQAMTQLIEEALRHEEFPTVEFRESIVGRQAYVAGSGLAVWEFVMVAESYVFDGEPVALHFEWPRDRVDGVLAYYRAHSSEIDSAIRENDAITPEQMRESLPDAIWGS